LLPGALQVDLSFGPAAEFGARGPRFRLLFGEAVEKPWAAPPSLEFEFGLAVHHAVRGYLCLERGRLWQAEYWISALRDHTLTLACLRRGLEASYGRGFDGLPAEVRDPLAASLVGELTADGLRRALAVATTGLLREAGNLSEVERVRPMLAEIFGLLPPRFTLESIFGSVEPLPNQSADLDREIEEAMEDHADEVVRKITNP
jgi:hypothetical protein